MARSRKTWSWVGVAAAFVLVASAAVGPSLPAAAEPARDDLTPAQRLALRSGLQIASKGSAAKAKAGSAASVNPYLANLPSLAKADYSGWRQRLAAGGAQRAASKSLATNRTRAAGRALAPAFVHDEEEPAGTLGSNDTQADAEPVSGFGTGRRENPRVRILGSLATTSPLTSRAITTREENGSLGTATPTGIVGRGQVTVTSVLGDGAYGGPAGSNDFDFFAVSTTAGRTVTVDTTASAVGLDTVVAVYDAAGDVLGVDDDAFVAPNPLASRLAVRVPADGTYYVLVAGYSPEGPLPGDPTDPASGAGGADRGTYAASISLDRLDTDYFALQLDRGDVIGSVGNGAAGTLTVWRPDGTQMVGSPGQDASSLYAPESPLPGGGNTTLAYVAEESGTYALQVDGAPGAYDTLVEVYRPGSEIDPASRVQTIFLDFDGARVNTGIWGGPGVRTLSPFSAFVAQWGLTRSQEATLIDRITATVRENVQRDLAEQGLNDNLAVRVINSRTSADIFGRPNVSRVIVGGTIAQSGIDTIGIAQYIDPGNYGHEDSALVLLDVLSGDPAEYEEASLNYYLRPTSDRVGFVSRAVANVISHEIGHNIGNYHTENSNDVHNLMDSGGGFFGVNLYGVGPDGIGGTADDEDIDFRTDRYSVVEGFTGLENTLNVSAWAFVRGGSSASPATVSSRR